MTPAANASGSATVTVSVNNGGASNNIVTQTFTVTVNAVNQAPTLNALNNLTINENAGRPVRQFDRHLLRPGNPRSRR